MNLSVFDRCAWVTGLCGQVLLLLVLWVRRRAKSFPVFTLYVAWSVLSTAILTVVLFRQSHRVYFYAYWYAEFIDEALQLLVFYELAVQVFCPTGTWASDVRKTFFGLVGVSGLLAFLLSWLAHPAARLPIQIFLLRSNFFSAVLLSELFIGSMVLSITAGLPWKTHVARIAQGLGAYSLICAARDIASTYAGIGRDTHIFSELDRLRVVAYVMCETYWIVMLWRDAPAPRELPEAVRIKLYTLQKQVEDDLSWIRKWKAQK
jgi:hypothetical protein